MSWFRVDDGFIDHPKLEELESDPQRWARCVAIWVAAGCYCSRANTDGFISDARLRRVSPLGSDASTDASTLVEIGLWEREEDGYRFHDFHDYNPSRKEVASQRKQRRERQQRWREKKAQARAGGSPDEDGDDAEDACVDDLQDASLDASRDAAPRARVPVPSRPVPSQDPSFGRITTTRARDPGRQVGMPELAEVLTRFQAVTGLETSRSFDREERRCLDVQRWARTRRGDAWLGEVDRAIAAFAAADHADMKSPWAVFVASPGQWLDAKLTTPMTRGPMRARTSEEFGEVEDGEIQLARQGVGNLEEVRARLALAQQQHPEGARDAS